MRAAFFENIDFPNLFVRLPALVTKRQPIVKVGVSLYVHIGGKMDGLKRGLFALIAVLFASASLWAQATAQISGTVKDQSGAVLPGVEVTATQTQTGRGI